jgi:DNA-binding NtrC family response regulator
MNEHVSPLQSADGMAVSPPDPQGHGQSLHGCVVSKRPMGEQGLDPAYPSDGVTLDAIHDLAAAVRVLAARRSGFNIAFIMYDDFDQDTATIDLLRRLRVRSPNLPVVLISEKFRAHDLTQERLCIADVSLRGPMSAGLVRIAVSAAAENNMAWRKRRRSLRLEKARQ